MCVCVLGEARPTQEQEVGVKAVGRGFLNSQKRRGAGGNKERGPRARLDLAVHIDCCVQWVNVPENNPIPEPQHGCGGQLGAGCRFTAKSRAARLPPECAGTRGELSADLP